MPTASAYQPVYQGGTDSFVMKLTPAGDALAYATYLGGSAFDDARAIAVDSAGSAYIAGFHLALLIFRHYRRFRRHPPEA